LPEQHWLSLPHELPSVLQLALSGVQVWLLPHAPPQQSALLVHAPLSDTHWVPEHTLPTQLTEQQSVGAPHDVPAEPHVVGFAVQAPVIVSQMPEQHSLLAVQPEPKTPHGNSASTLPAFFLPPPHEMATATTSATSAGTARRSVMLFPLRTCE
jgi:hypothetical protein